MKKLFTLIAAVMTALTMSAQAVGINAQKVTGVLEKKSSVMQMPRHAAPQKALAEGQYYMGSFATDDYSENGLGITGAPGDYEILAYLPTRLIEAFDGGKVVGMRFAVSQAARTSKVVMYNYTEEEGLTELVSGRVESSHAGWNEVMFDEPLTLDVSSIGNLLMGYNYTQTSQNYPIAYTQDGTITTTYIYGNLGSQGVGLYDVGLSEYGNLCVQAIVEKEFPAYGVSAVSAATCFAAAGEEAKALVTFQNTGAQAVNNISYTVTLDGETSEEKTVSASADRFGLFFNAELPLGVQDEVCNKVYTVTVTKVNGEANASEKNTIDIAVSFIGEVFTRIPVLEEFTGTGCGYCPRGYAGLETLREEMPGEVICIAVHQYNSSDPMYIATNSYCKLGFSGAPQCTIDRGEYMDPFYGTGNNPMGIRDAVNAAKEVYAPVAVEVSGVFSDDKTTVDAKASVKSHSDNAEYDIEYVLVADGLQNDSWAQSNYYYQYTPAQAGATGNVLSKFCSGGEWGKASVKGLTFNDVAIASSYEKNENKTEPIVVTEAYAPVENSYTLSLPTKRVKLYTAIQNSDYNVYVVALVVDKATGAVLNASKAKVQTAGESNGIENVGTDASVIARYNAAGQLINGEQKGINIVKMSNGKTVKVLVK